VIPPDPVESSTAVDRRIEARIAELAGRIRAVIHDPDSPQRDVDRAMSELMPELQRLTEHLEAAGGPRFVRVCEGCGRLDLRTRWRKMTEPRSSSEPPAPRGAAGGAVRPTSSCWRSATPWA